MESLNLRVREIRTREGLSQTEFAERIGLSKNFISLVETGGRIPSDRTISDICREFGVNEIWLRTGAGDAYAPPSRAEELGRLVKSLMADRPEAFRARLITALLRFDPDGPEWQVLENIYDSVAAQAEKEKDDR